MFFARSRDIRTSPRPKKRPAECLAPGFSQ